MFLRVVTSVVVAVAGAVAAADALDHDRLRQELGGALPTGHGVVVAQVEAAAKVAGDPAQSARRSYAPDRAHKDFAATHFVTATPLTTWGGGHATIVARRYYGASNSFAPNVEAVHLFEIRDFMRRLGRMHYTGDALGAARVWNHSWIAGGGLPVGMLLRQLDRAAAAQQWLVVVGVNNRGANQKRANQPLLASAYNLLSVGRSDGLHASGPARVDKLYGRDRVRPHLVAPATTTSVATAIVSSAGALLVEVAGDRALSRDPAQNSVTTAHGSVNNAGRAITLRAALLAGARRDVPAPDDGIGYRANADVRADNGLDVRFGAGQLNVRNSYCIIAAGEFNHRDDDPDAQPLPVCGFDVDPHFGGAGDSNRVARYEVRPGSDQTWTVALVWPVVPAHDSKIYDLDLVLRDDSDEAHVVADSRSRADASEHLQVPLQGGRRYILEVSAATPDAFDIPFALAWMAAARDGRADLQIAPARAPAPVDARQQKAE